MKKLLCLTLVFVMIFTSTCYVFAAEQTHVVGQMSLEDKIEAAKALEYAELHKQLEAQDALELMDLFIGELEPIIETEVRIANGMADSSLYSTNDFRLNYPESFLHGGKHFRCYFL